MVGTNLKAETMCLIEKRDGLEIEMNFIIDRLCQTGGPGITGNLLDFEGFPRSDIDVPAVRADRCRLSELRNDHKDITNKINENLEVLHSARLAPKNPAGHLANTRPPESGGVAFAMVDEIAEGSPSAEDGLQLGDQIVKFGSVCGGGDLLLQRLASEAHSNQGRQVDLVLLRQGLVTNLALTPRPWHGRGLLGCHFRILL